MNRSIATDPLSFLADPVPNKNLNADADNKNNIIIIITRVKKGRRDSNLSDICS
jgi:hypothetical protein